MASISERVEDRSNSGPDNSDRTASRKAKVQLLKKLKSLIETQLWA